jgi:hypothetical protein
MSHLFIVFCGYVLRPRVVAIRDGTVRFEISFEFFFAHSSSLPLFIGSVEAKAERVVNFLGGNKRGPVNPAAYNEEAPSSVSCDRVSKTNCKRQNA